MLWGFFSSPAPAVTLLLQALLLILVLQIAASLYNDFNQETDESKVTEKEDIPSPILLIILALLGVWLAYTLGSGTLLCVIIWGILVAGYPYLAQVTWWPQVCYGFVFGAWPVLIGQSAAGEANFNAIPLMIAAFFWATALETLRVDTSLDKKDRLHFIREILGPQRFSFITVCMITSLVFLVLTGLVTHMTGIFYGGLMIAQGIMTYTFQMHGNEKENDISYRTYQYSGLAGLAIALGFMLG